MSSWRTVPINFPDYDDLDNETQYHLSEGYCVNEYESKKSGKNYKKIRFYEKSEKKYIDMQYAKLISYLGYESWWVGYRKNTFNILLKKWRELITDYFWRKE